MSNCMDILNSNVAFSDADMDLEALRSWTDRAKAQDEDDLRTLEQYEEWQAVNAWWFLSINVKYQGAFVFISLGNGRSSHTFRDFRSTIRLLAQFVRRPVTLSLMVQDGEPGNEGYWKWQCTLLPGGLVDGLA